MNEDIGLAGGSGSGGVRLDQFSAGVYFWTLAALARRPSRFFAEMPDETGWRVPLGVLIVSSLFYAAMGSTLVPENGWLMAGIFFINALGMVVLNALAGFGLAVGLLRLDVRFARIFAVYALVNGAVLLISWTPSFIWFTEPLKWALLGIGLVRACRMGRFQAVLLIGLSLGVVYLFFRGLVLVLPPGGFG